VASLPVVEDIRVLEDRVRELNTGASALIKGAATEVYTASSLSGVVK